MKYYLSVAILLRREYSWILQLIEYHKLMGVEHFFFFEPLANSDPISIEPVKKKDIIEQSRTTALLQSYIDNGILTLIPFNNARSSVSHCFHQVLQLLRGTSCWVALLQENQFILPHSRNDLPALLRKYQSHGALAMTHQLFQLSPTFCSQSLGSDQRVSWIVQPLLLASIESSKMTFFAAYSAVNTSYQVIHDSYDYSFTSDVLQLNCYSYDRSSFEITSNESDKREKLIVGCNALPENDYFLLREKKSPIQRFVALLVSANSLPQASTTIEPCNNSVRDYALQEINFQYGIEDNSLDVTTMIYRDLLDSQAVINTPACYKSYFGDPVPHRSKRLKATLSGSQVSLNLPENSLLRFDTRLLHCNDKITPLLLVYFISLDEEPLQRIQTLSNQLEHLQSINLLSQSAACYLELSLASCSDNQAVRLALQTVILQIIPQAVISYHRQEEKEYPVLQRIWGLAQQPALHQATICYLNAQRLTAITTEYYDNSHLTFPWLMMLLADEPHGLIWHNCWLVKTQQLRADLCDQPLASDYYYYQRWSRGHSAINNYYFSCSAHNQQDIIYRCNSLPWVNASSDRIKFEYGVEGAYVDVSDQLYDNFYCDKILEERGGAERIVPKGMRFDHNNICWTFDKARIGSSLRENCQGALETESLKDKEICRSDDKSEEIIRSPTAGFLQIPFGTNYNQYFTDNAQNAVKHLKATLPTQSQSLYIKENSPFIIDLSKLREELPAIICVYFINCEITDLYLELFRAQFSDLEKSGLLQRFTTIYIQATIDSAREAHFRAEVSKVLPAAVVSCHQGNSHEYPGILKVWQLGQTDGNDKLSDDTMVLYFHSKGISRVKELFAQSGAFQRCDWEQRLSKHVLMNYAHMLPWFQTLTSSDKYGYLTGEVGWIWFNYWFVKVKYLRNCSKPLLSDNRYYYEHWLASQENDRVENYYNCLSSDSFFLSQRSYNLGSYFDPNGRGTVSWQQ